MDTHDGSQPRPSPSEPPDAPAGPSPVRRWALRVVIVLLGAAAGTGGLLAYANYTSAQRWQQTAEANAARAERHAGQRDEALAASEEAAEALAASEADVRRLEGRIRELADEKAQVEDERQQLMLTAASYADLLGRVRVSADAVDTCVEYMAELNNRSTEAWNLMVQGGDPDIDALNQLRATTFDFCNTARERHAATVAYVEQLR